MLKKYEFRFIDREKNVKNIFLSVDSIQNRYVASLMDITRIKRLNSLLECLSEINEMVARENNPEFLLKTVCEKLRIVYDAVFTALRKDGRLIPVRSEGIDSESIKKAIKHCPSISNALKGETTKMRMNDELCEHCMSKRHRYVLSIPLSHNETYGVITIHSGSEFNPDEITLLEKLSKNIAFAISAYEVEKDRKRAFDQLAVNLTQFEHSADRLRNPLAAIMSAIELKDELGIEKMIEMIGEQTERMKYELDEMRREEERTYELIRKTL
jgi:tRNA nucleotidyltransferase (CCA-adding enzyme)